MYICINIYYIYSSLLFLLSLFLRNIQSQQESEANNGEALMQKMKMGVEMYN